MNEEAETEVFSNLLGELKEKYGDEIMLIPIAADNNISSVDILIEMYNVTELPTILIDEDIRITELQNITELEKHLE